MFGVLNMLVSVSSFLPIIIVGPDLRPHRDDRGHPRRRRRDPRLGRGVGPLARAQPVDDRRDSRPARRRPDRRRPRRGPADAGGPTRRRRPARCRRRAARRPAPAGGRRAHDAAHAAAPTRSATRTDRAGRPRRPRLDRAMPLDSARSPAASRRSPGDAGFGWVEAIGIRDGRVAFAGSRGVPRDPGRPVHASASAWSRTRSPSPGLTDAHLHLAQAALADAPGRPDRRAATLDDGLRPARRGPSRRRRRTPGSRAHGWDSDRWGGWPTADDLERVAPGRRIAIWAHDHHALWASHAALALGGVRRPTTRPAASSGGRRTGTPEGVLYRDGDPARDDPRPAHEPTTTSPTPSSRLGRRAPRARRRRLPRPGRRRRRIPDLTYSFPAYARLSDAGRLPVRVHACMRDDAVAAADRAGLPERRPLGEDPDGRPGSAGRSASPTGRSGRGPRRSSRTSSPSPTDRSPPEQRRGVWMTDPDGLRERVARATAGGIATQIHAIGDAAVRERARRPRRRRAADAPLMPRIEHVQMLHPDDRPRFAAERHRRQRPAGPPRLGRRAGPQAVGRAGRGRGLHLAAASPRPARSSPFGTDAPVEPYRPVARDRPGRPTRATRAGRPARRPTPRSRRCPSTGPCAPTASTRRSPRARLDRGRLTVGQRADVVVIRPRRSTEPVEPGGAAVDDPPGAGPARRRGRLRALISRADDAPGLVELAQRIGEQPVEDPRRRREGVDRLGQDVDRDAGLDRQHALVDRGRGVRAGHRRADELAASPRSTTIVTWPSVASIAVAAGARREVGDELEGVEARLAGRLDGDARRTPPRDPCRSRGAAPGSPGTTASPSAIRTASSPW